VGQGGMITSSYAQAQSTCTGATGYSGAWSDASQCDKASYATGSVDGQAYVGGSRIPFFRHCSNGLLFEGAVRGKVPRGFVGPMRFSVGIVLDTATLDVQPVPVPRDKHGSDVRRVLLFKQQAGGSMTGYMRKVLMPVGMGRTGMPRFRRFQEAVRKRILI